MSPYLDGILIFVAFSNLLLLGVSRLSMCIRLSAMQGILLGLLPIVIAPHDLSWHKLAMAAGIFVLKGGVFPYLLFRAMREADVRREIEPILGFAPSILAGALAWLLSFWIGNRLSLPGHALSPLTFSVAIYTLLVGLILIITRRKALTQVLGFIILENGIFTFGVGIETDFLVELGIFLDIFVAVFVMGIAIFHIQREFNHIDTDQLTFLKD